MIYEKKLSTSIQSPSFIPKREKKKRREYACVFIVSMCASLHVITWDVLNITACGFLLDSDGVQGTLSLKVHIVKAMVFLVVMYECESWTIKKAEHPRIYVFELCCWRRLLRVPWTARRSNKPVLKEINPEYFIERTDAEGSILWPLDAKSRLIGKTIAGKD